MVKEKSDGLIDKDDALKEALKAIERTYGKGSVMLMGQKTHVDVDAIPSGSLLLDEVLGVGGYPRGRIIEIYGPESSGKTTLALHAVAEAQKKGGRAAYVDAEHAIDPEYAAKLGVDIDELILSQPDNGEQALEIVDMLAQSGAIDIIIVDSHRLAQINGLIHIDEDRFIRGIGVIVIQCNESVFLLHRLSQL